MSYLSTRNPIVAFSMVVALAACGGGGGDSNNANAVTNNQTVPTTGANHAEAEAPGPQYSASWAAASVIAECRALIPDAQILRVYAQFSAANDGLTDESNHWEIYMMSPTDPTQVCGGLVRHASRTTEPAGIVNYAPGYSYAGGEVVTDWRIDSTDVAGLPFFDEAVFDGFFFDLRPAAHHRATGAFVPDEVQATTPVVRIAVTPGSPQYAMLNAITGEVLFDAAQ